ncbi:MAG: hypothetical protein LBV08_05570, partial [Clostridiales bacterium]|nr:hypothetical protein [Clostridiales bacterium]
DIVVYYGPAINKGLKNGSCFYINKIVGGLAHYPETIFKTPFDEKTIFSSDEATLTGCGEDLADTESALVYSVCCQFFKPYQIFFFKAIGGNESGMGVGHVDAILKFAKMAHGQINCRKDLLQDGDRLLLGKIAQNLSLSKTNGAYLYKLAEYGKSKGKGLDIFYKYADIQPVGKIKGKGLLNEIKDEALGRKYVQKDIVDNISGYGPGTENLDDNCQNSFNSPFSHVYIERGALRYENTAGFLKRFKNSKIIMVDNYQDIFSKGSFYYQKKSQNLILAVKKGGQVYKGSEYCDSFGNENFYYTTSIMNCIFDCEYCFLQGMYHSANVVVFVNIEETFSELEKILKGQDVYLCISYDTDILAFESLFHLTREWVAFASKHKNLKIEVRTKSANFHLLKDMPFTPNVIFAWTISPDLIIKKFEHKTPVLKKRAQDMKLAASLGYKIRVCIDPLIYIDNFETVYSGFIDDLFSQIESKDILDISIGVFRVNKAYFKKMKKQRFESEVLNYPFETKSNALSYDGQLKNWMLSFIYKKLCLYVNAEKIFITR